MKVQFHLTRGIVFLDFWKYSGSIPRSWKRYRKAPTNPEMAKTTLFTVSYFWLVDSGRNVRFLLWHSPWPRLFMGHPTLVWIGTLEFTLFRACVCPCVRANFSQRATIVFFWNFSWSYTIIRGKSNILWFSKIIVVASPGAQKGSKTPPNWPKMNFYAQLLIHSLYFSETFQKCEDNGSRCEMNFYWA